MRGCCARALSADALTPIYSFGESETYYTFTPLLRLRLALNGYGLPAVAFFGWPLFPVLPRTDSQVFTYVGAPLQLPSLPEPTAGQVDEWHAKYVAALRELFDASKAEAGQPDAVLELW